MRLVIDTNVLVAALLHPGRTPDRALSRALAEGTLLLDERIEAEYREVLARPKFASIPRQRRDALLAALLRRAERVAAEPAQDAMTDEHDRVFVEVARGGRAEALVTGNIRHFPATLGLCVLTPAELLARLGEPQEIRERTSSS
jgi:putative PIN family toxin of toxin-antitoxin system